MGTRKPPKWTRKGCSEAEVSAQLGVSKTTVQSWKRKGWAVLFADGSIDVESTARKVEQARDPRGTKRLRLRDPAPTAQPAAPAGSPAHAPLDEDDLLTARTRKERALADRAELDVLQRRGELIQVEDARRTYASTITSARVALEAVPARVAPQVLGLTSQIEIRRIVQAEIASALRSLPEEAPRVE